jgi:hypothetical protein
MAEARASIPCQQVDAARRIPNGEHVPCGWFNRVKYNGLKRRSLHIQRWTSVESLWCVHEKVTYTGKPNAYSVS